MPLDAAYRGQVLLFQITIKESLIIVPKRFTREDPPNVVVDWKEKMPRPRTNVRIFLKPGNGRAGKLGAEEWMGGESHFQTNNRKRMKRNLKSGICKPQDGFLFKLFPSK